jgi:hypothetical protein
MKTGGQDSTCARGSSPGLSQIIVVTTFISHFLYYDIESLRNRAQNNRKSKKEAEPEYLSREFLPEEVLQSLTILGEFFDAFVELVESHLLLEERPSEFGFVVNIRDFGQCVCLRSYRDKRGYMSQLGHQVMARTGVRVKFSGDRLSRIFEFFKQGGRDSEEVDACKCLDFASL